MPDACSNAALPPRGRPSRRQTALGWMALAVLAAIAVGIYAAQSRFNPAVLNFLEGPALLAEISASARPLPDLPEGLAALAPPERFDRETLSDKIDGKAELYLSAGFVRLDCQRIALAGRPQDWIEAFVYDMGSAPNAYAVFSLQRRSDGTPLDFAEFAYRAENALFLAHGSFYLELVASGRDEPLQAALEALARSFMAGRPAAAKTAIAERDLFPREGLVEGSIRLIPADAFGMAGLDRVFTAAYASDGAEMTAFLSRRANPGEAAELARSYVDFLKTYGGEAVPADPSAGGAAVVAILDMYEVVFVRGAFFAGVHEAPGREEGLELAARLAEKLAEVPHAP